MGFFEQDGNNLIFRENGETLMITPWGKDSLRVRSVFLGDIIGDNFALLEPEEECKAEIVIASDKGATITNGKITADCSVNSWGNRLLKIR